MRTQPAAGFQPLNLPISESIRFQGAESYALDSIHLRRHYGVRRSEAYIFPVAADVYSREDYLAVTCGGSLYRLGGYVLRFSGAHPAARGGDYAVGAESVAAVLYLDESPGAVEVSHGGIPVEFPAKRRHTGNVTALREKLRHQLRQPGFIGVARYDIGGAVPVGFVGIRLGIAAAEDCHAVRIKAAAVGYRLARLFYAHARHRAGVYDTDVRRLPLRRRIIPGSQESVVYRCALAGVHLAAESQYTESHGFLFPTEYAAARQYLNRAFQQRL